MGPSPSEEHSYQEDHENECANTRQKVLRTQARDYPFHEAIEASAEVRTSLRVREERRGWRGQGDK